MLKGCSTYPITAVIHLQISTTATTYHWILYNTRCVGEKKGQDSSITVTFGTELVCESAAETVNFEDVGGRESLPVTRIHKITVICCPPWK